MTALVRKLGIGEGDRVAFVDAPEGFAATLGALPHGVRMFARGSRAGSLDVIVAFFTERRALARRIDGLTAQMDPAGALWIAWPKRGSELAGDLSDGVVRELGLAAGVVDNKVCAIDASWSALRFSRRLRDR